jgi:hypothetical protein
VLVADVTVDTNVVVVDCVAPSQPLTLHSTGHSTVTIPPDPSTMQSSWVRRPQNSTASAHDGPTVVVTAAIVVAMAVAVVSATVGAPSSAHGLQVAGHFDTRRGPTIALRQRVALIPSQNGSSSGPSEHEAVVATIEVVIRSGLCPQRHNTGHAVCNNSIARASSLLHWSSATLVQNEASATESPRHSAHFSPPSCAAVVVETSPPTAPTQNTATNPHAAARLQLLDRTIHPMFHNGCAVVIPNHEQGERTKTPPQAFTPVTPL